jgi:hypothetical protein
MSAGSQEIAHCQLAIADWDGDLTDGLPLLQIRKNFLGRMNAKSLCSFQFKLCQVNAA